MEATGKIGKKLQELGAFVLAGAKDPQQLCTMAEMIRSACDYRWVGIYKIVRGDFVIVAKTGECPPAYPRFPITQGLAGAAVESKQAVMVADVHKDPRYLPTFGSTQSEIVVPVITESQKVVGLIDVESEKLNAFTDNDRDFLEHAAFLIARALK
ncbi:MAG TPA: GAF domain-containing protein [Chthoniobacterales bacterium]|jgi:GAF domain-containing protein|nr:GAF domain-containing protein [Chthoniobacterales bacterium]